MFLVEHSENLDKKELAKIVSEVEKENSLFVSKVQLDTLTFPSKIIGRKDRVKELVGFLATHKQGLVVPFIAVYGRSGSGKSTIVKFVCENLDGISSCFVNLRKARTVFGSANLILAELGEPNLKSAQGINLAVERIQTTILSVLKKLKTSFLSWPWMNLTCCFMISAASLLISFTNSWLWKKS